MNIDNIKYYFIRNYHLIFNRNKCIKLYFDEVDLLLGDVVVSTSDEPELKCLGMGWYYILGYTNAEGNWIRLNQSGFNRLTNFIEKYKNKIIK